MRIKIEGNWPTAEVLPVCQEFETAKAALTALRRHQTMGLRDIRICELHVGAVVRLSESELRYLASKEAATA